MPARVRKVHDLPQDPVAAGTGNVRQVLAGPGQGSGCHIRRFLMEPGGGTPRPTDRIEILEDG